MHFDTDCIFYLYQEAFEKAAEEVKVLKQRPSNDELTELYGLYKQGTCGDVNIGECFKTEFKEDTHNKRVLCHFLGYPVLRQSYSEVWLRDKNEVQQVRCLNCYLNDDRTDKFTWNCVLVPILRHCNRGNS